MKLLKILFIIIVVLIIGALGTYWYAGGFTSVTVTEKVMGGYVVAGADYVGPYSGVYPTMQEVDTKLKDAGIVCTRGFGIYYDDPSITPEAELKSFVGNVIDGENLAKIDQVLATKLKMDTIELAKSVVVEFDAKMSLAYMIGPTKAYPALTAYMKEKGIKPFLSFEYYDMPAKKAYYVMQYK